MGTELIENHSTEISINARIKATQSWNSFLAEYPQFESGLISKEFLLEKGFVFMNRVGNGQRAIIQQVFDKAGNVVADFSDNLFLTEEDLNLLRKYTVPENFKSLDDDNGEETIDMEEVQKIGEEMEDFIVLAQNFAWFWSFMEKDTSIRYYASDMHRLESNAEIMIRIIEDRLGSKLMYPKFANRFLSEDEKKLNTLHTLLVNFINAVKNGIKDADMLDEKINTAFQEIRKKYSNTIPRTFHGISPEQIKSRNEGKEVVGINVPFIAEDNFFRQNNGIYIYDFEGKINGEPNKYRINNICSYLAKHGICNTGTPEDPDQRYITIEEFYKGILLVDADRTMPDISMYSNIEDEILMQCFKEVTGMQELSMEVVRFAREIIGTATYKSHYDKLIDRFLNGDFAK